MRSLFPLATFLLALPATGARAATVDIVDTPERTVLSVPREEGVEFDVSHTSKRITITLDSTAPDLQPISPPRDSRVSVLTLIRGQKKTMVEIGYECDCIVAIDSVKNGPVSVEFTDFSGVDSIEASSEGADEDAPAFDVASIARETAAALGGSTDEKEPEEKADKPASPRRDLVPATAMQPVFRSDERPAPREEVAPRAPMRTPPPLKKVGRPDYDGVDAMRDQVLTQLTEGALAGIVHFKDGHRPTPAAPREPIRGLDDPNAPPCPRGEVLDMRRFSTGMGFRDTLAELRAKLFDDLKQVDPTAVRELARHYLSFGLGAEARSIIRSFETSGPGESTILEMATIVEDPVSRGESLGIVQAGCGARAAVWRAAYAAGIEPEAVLAAYTESEGMLFDLPPELKKMLGGRIALALVDTGAFQQAEQLLSGLQNSGGIETPELQLLTAYRITSTGAIAPSIDRLLDLTSARSPVALEAGVRAARLIGPASSAKQQQRAKDAMDELLYLHKTGPRAGEILEAYVGMVSRLGDMPTAVQLLTEWRDDIPSENRTRLEELRGEIVLDALDSDLLTKRPETLGLLVAAAKTLDGSDASNAARVSFARNLNEMGAAHLVPEVLSVELVMSMPEARLALAKAQMLTGNYQPARETIGRMQSETAGAMRVEIDRRLGRDVRDDVDLKFGPKMTIDDEGPLARARRLLRDATGDMQTIEEMMRDG